MANTFLTPTIIADLGLLALKNNLILGNLFYRGHDKEFRKVGDTIKVRKPATFTAIEFDGDLTGEFQNITEGSVDVKLDKQIIVPFEITQKQMSLDVKDLQIQVVDPAVRVVAQYIDALCAGLYADIPYFVDVSGTPVVGDISGVRKKLLNNMVPMDEGLVWGVLCPDTEAKYNVLDAFLHAEKRGDTETVKRGIMGQLFGIRWAMDQNMKTHVIGTTDLAGDLAADATAADTTINVHALGTGTVNKGSLITLEGSTYQYVVTATGTIVTNAIAALAIYPAIKETVVATKLVTIHAIDKANMVFHRNAFCLATAPLQPPLDGTPAANREDNGINMQVVFSWNHLGMKNVGTVSVLCGVKTLQQELALRFCDL